MGILYQMGVKQLLYFEELPLGEEWLTRGRTLTEAILTAYIGMAGDFNPLYTDYQSIVQGPEQGIMIPAGLIISVALGLGSIDLPLLATAALVGTNWRFLQPTRVGDTIYTRWRLSRKRSIENPQRGLAGWQIEVLNQKDDLVATGEVIRLIDRKPQTALEDSPPPRRRRRRRPPRPKVEEGTITPSLTPSRKGEGIEETGPPPEPSSPPAEC